MKDIKRRLERLEQATMPDEDRECIVFLCVNYLQGDLIGLEGNGVTVNRLPGETEKQLYDRAVIKIRKTAPSFSAARDGKDIYMLHEVREKSERDDEVSKYLGVAPAAPETKPEPVRGPEPKPEPRPLRKEIIEVKNTPGAVSGHWMMG
jgi:hypothetical protein